ncbi:uncharacterized protein F4822DRAFT_435325 [Hypoxylon trugodes]|uniref:uncharacterized protein n=1 Tax=Hypoxylon trugodes TaxID=326681 RepID=UPI0021A02DA9|nr:uncharacterized protein F4822DRAFT_435325 [Hypoxylon trugodes]KAI1382649.1 hypothetical protein F4822DRAFT_435325 [Hypoxylon trugodes]
MSGATMESLGLRETHLKFPTQNNRVINQDPDTVRANALSTQIIMHWRYPELVNDFLAHKRQYGTSLEKALYHKDWTWNDQVRRLIEKRPLVFYTDEDVTIMRDGSRRDHTFWDNIGREGRDFDVLEESLTYDEIMLGSLLGVSGRSGFINSGSRRNRAQLGKPGEYETNGIIVGLVGARFERPGLMDSMFIEGKGDQNPERVQFRNMFMKFFDTEKTSTARFDGKTYVARMRITAEMLLLEANERAKQVGKKAYVHIVGLGLGVWQIDRAQVRLFVEAFYSAMFFLSASLKNIGTLDFSWVSPDPRGDADWPYRDVDSDTLPSLDMKIKFSKRDPAAKLTGDEADQLLVVSYAWDGNAFPGNEYWAGSLDASGDPAAACMSNIAELHNPLINPGFLERQTVLTPEQSSL